ncbi:MAG: hydrogen gas-evolving membrane-bound hydrogenase subunit E [Planctomycetota bacterium]
MPEHASVWLVLIAVLAPVTAGVATIWLPKSAVALRVAVALCGPVTAFFCILASLSVGGLDRTPNGEVGWLPSLNINLAFLTDGLGAFFGLLVSGIGAMIVLYARGYFGKEGPTSKEDLARFYPLLGFFMTAMVGLVLADYTLLTLLFWEMTSISSFFLIGWDRYNKHAVKLGMQAFFTTGLGGLGLLGGILLFGDTTGVWRWSTMLEGAGSIDWNSSGVLWAFVLMFIGAAAKSAQWPAHYWLPGAMAAPTPVSAFLHSATMVKAGVFLTGRLMPAFMEVDQWAGVIVPFGAVTMLIGGVLALNQHDLKRIFAYTTVSQLGLLMTMYGLAGYTYKGPPTIDYDITQIANHAFYKAPLFIAAGAIGHVASRQLPELFGAFHKHKAICITMLLAGYALAAGPGTISFPAKELFLYAVYHAAEEAPWLWLVMAMTVATAMCNVAIFVRLLTTLMGWRFGMKAEPHGHDNHDDHHHEHHHEHGVMAAMIWLPGLLIVSLQYLGGLIPPLWDVLFLPFETNANYFSIDKGVPSIWYAITHPSLPLGMSFLAMGGGVLLGISKLARHEHKDIHDKIYPLAYFLSVTGGGKVFRLVQTGNLKHYMLFILGFFLLMFGWAALPDDAMRQMVALTPGSGYGIGILLGAITCFTALAIPFTKARIIRVVFLGATGFSVVGIYIVYQAPDLALTQLMFEIISVILFVIVLRLLPKEKIVKQALVGKVGRVAIAASVGLAFGWMTLTAASSDPEFRVGETLAQHSYGNYEYNAAGEKVQLQPTALDTTRGGGGDNIVNVILVDFRALDTYGEIAVLGLAAIGVWSMLPRRKRGRPDLNPGPHRTLVSEGPNANPHIAEGGAA